jgi:hypothetical protein
VAAIIDMNNDTTKDIVIIERTANTITIFYNQGNHKFPSRKSYPSGTTPRSFAVKDVSHDAIPDVIVVNINFNDLRIHLGAANGYFTASYDLSI